MLSQTELDDEKGRMLRNLSHLVEISVTLNSTLDPEKLLQFIICSAAEVLDCEAASILLYDETRGQLYFATASGDSRQLARIPVPLDGSIAGTIFQENRPLVINEVAADPRHYQQVGEQVSFQARSLLGVPMCIKSRVTGVLEALNKRQGDFNDEDVHILSVIASQAAVAIHNAQLLHALQKANEELRKLDKLKSDFISIASHELRTPLGVILGYATFLKDEAQGELSEHAEMVLNSALKMRTLVEDMTNLNTMQMGTTQLALQPSAIQKVLKQAFQDIQETARAKELAFSVNMPDKPILVNADPAKLEQVFANLMNNAVRFTPQGGKVNLSVLLEKNEVRVLIRDSGIGIPRQDLEKIFEEFYQVENHLRRHMGGMGLGLSIARGLLKLHNGRIWAESPGEGKGSTFTVVLPVMIQSSPPSSET